MKNYIHILYVLYIFPDDLDGKEYACNTGDPGLIPGWKRSPGEGNGNRLQHSFLEKSHGQTEEPGRLVCRVTKSGI